MPRTKPVRRAARHNARHAQPKRVQTAIVVAPANVKPWLLSAEEVTILKNAICKGATDEEMKYCLTVARRYELDPFQKQIWFVPRWDRDAENSEGQRGGKVWVPVVGIDGLCNQAATYHADYGTFSEPEYGPMTEITYQKSGKGPFLKMKAPEWARVKVFKKGSLEPSIGIVWWSEIYPDVNYAPLVRRMPRLMLAKCARAQAIRAAYPKKTAGLLIPEELHNQEFQQITPEGRVYHVEQPALNQAEENWQKREREGLEKLTPAQREVVERRMREAEQRDSGAEPPKAGSRVADAVPVSASAEMPTAPIPALFFTYFPESKTYRIDGDQQLKKANRDLLAPLFNKVADAIVATPSDLGRLISQFEQRKVPFKELQRAQP